MSAFGVANNLLDDASKALQSPASQCRGRPAVESSRFRFSRAAFTTFRLLVPRLAFSFPISPRIPGISRSCRVMPTMPLPMIVVMSLAVAGWECELPVMFVFLRGSHVTACCLLPSASFRIFLLSAPCVAVSPRRSSSRDLLAWLFCTIWARIKGGKDTPDSQIPLPSRTSQKLHVSFSSALKTARASSIPSVCGGPARGRQPASFFIPRPPPRLWICTTRTTRVSTSVSC